MTDVGMAAAWIGSQTDAQLDSRPLRGGLFETMVANDFLKGRANAGLRETLYYWRDNIGIVPVGSSPEATTRFLDDELARWVKPIATARVKAA